MKKVESNEQLLERFFKRTAQLETRKEELREAHEEYIRIESDLKRLEGSIQAVEYIVFGKLPGDGNHDGMKNHQP